MGSHRRLVQYLIVILAVLMPLLVGCGATPTPTVVPPTAVPPTATAVPPTPTRGPTVGGTLVIVDREPVTFDPHVATNGLGGLAEQGASLVIKDPLGKYVPYLAESWKVSGDGLVWDIVLRKGVKFHDGSPLKAADFVYTYNRVKDPSTKAGAIAGLLKPLQKTEALSDYELRLTLSAPSFPFLDALSDFRFMGPLSRPVVEKWGDQYGRHPVTVGPYKLVEWITGQSVTLERNADYDWGPAYAHKGAPYIAKIVHRTITENETIVAGLEAGEIDWAGLLGKDVARIRATGKFQILEAQTQGIAPSVALNVTAPPFDDLRVRQAFNLAVDRSNLIKVVAQGVGIPQWGPMSPSQLGYWPGVEKIGYGFDLAKAKALMAEAGWKDADGDGILDKDGKPLRLDMKVNQVELRGKVAEVLQQQYKALGADIKLVKSENASWAKEVLSHDYVIAVVEWNYPEADILYLLFHSSNATAGGLNLYNVKDPELDKLLEATRTTMDPAKRQEVVNAAQKMMVEKAYCVPLYVGQTFVALSNKVKGAIWSAFATLYIEDAYIESK